MKTSILLLSAVLLAASYSSHGAATVGEQAPEFTLTDISGKTHSLSDFKGKYVVLEWTNFECPFVRKHYDSHNMQALQKKYTGEDVVWLTINSSADGKQGHYTPEKWQEMLKDEEAAPTTVLLDPDGKVGKMYGAKTTPHMFVIDPEGKLDYAGAIDSIKSADKSDVAKATNYVSAALDALKAGKPVETPTSQPYGCSVKY